jgi:hypothetical protein
MIRHELLNQMAPFLEFFLPRIIEMVDDIAEPPAARAIQLAHTLLQFSIFSPVSISPPFSTTSKDWSSA